MLWQNLTIIVVSYLLGAVPSALLFVKLFSKKDIRDYGTGNIGAMNSYDITGKKWMGILVFLADAAKGALAVMFARWLTGNDFYAVSLAASFAVIGHNFNAFLKFKGGRGLAAAFGAIILISPIAIILWAVMWVTGYYAIKRNVHIANVIGTIGMLLLLYGTPDEMILIMKTMPFWKTDQYLVMVTVIGILILARHFKPILELMPNKKEDESE